MAGRILLIEDDLFQQSLIQSALVRAGHAVDVAPPGLEAIWRIREGHFDLVLIDYSVPDIDGMATARLVTDIMGDPARPQLIALTATPDQVIGREGESSRAFDAVVAKSMGLSELLAIVKDLLMSAPPRAARSKAEEALLLDDWAAFGQPLARPPGHGGPSARPRVLVAEDDDVQRRVLTAALVQKGYDVEDCADGLTALRKMRESGFDVALIDYELPEIDGLASARLLCSLLTESVRPRLIAVTSAPERLAARSDETDPAFDDVVGKQEGLPAVFHAIARALAASPARLG